MLNVSVVRCSDFFSIISGLATSLLLVVMVEISWPLMVGGIAGVGVDEEDGCGEVKEGADYDDEQTGDCDLVELPLFPSS